MMKLLRMIAATAVATALSSPICLAQENNLFSFQQSDAVRADLLARQDEKYRRLDAKNLRAQQSICSGCADGRKVQPTQPADPFAPLPNWDDLTLAEALSTKLEPE